MRILHLHKNAIPYLNDDEGSISWSFRKLGHEVIDEYEDKWQQHRNADYDFTLFHHWHSGIINARYLPGKKVMWFFDHIDFATSGTHDAIAQKHTRIRKNYIKRMVDICDHIFHTDGEWSSSNATLLRQGADERMLSSIRTAADKRRKVLYVGGEMIEKRRRFIAMLRAELGDKFVRTNNVYRSKLRQIVQQHRIVVAPDSPITDRYWSNRVYVMLGYGCLLLHPYCAKLAEEYEDGKEIIFYHDVAELLERIDYYLSHAREAKEIAMAGLERTRKEHLYTHRVKRLLEVIS